MYKVIMVSPGGIKRDFQGGFCAEIEADNYADTFDWQWTDENGFVWRLEVAEDYEPRPKLTIPKKQWAEEFREFLQHGDDQALNHLDSVFENTFNRAQRLEFIPIRRYVEALLCLNHVISFMEMDEIPTNIVIERAYQDMMGELIAIADSSSDLV